MGYISRKQAGSDFEGEIKDWIADRGYTVVHDGIESRYHPQHPRYRLLCELCKRGSEWALIERYKPDFYCEREDHKPFWVDPKRSRHIERYSFTACSWLDSPHAAVFFALPTNDGFAFVRPAELVWQQPDASNNPLGIPISGIWRCPRTLSASWTAEDAEEWARRFGSGTAFGVVDMEATLAEIEEFRHIRRK